VDLLSIKGRIALALVEGIFRRAGFTVTPLDQREVPPHLGRDDLPDFAVQRAGVADAGGEPPRLVEVRYRIDLPHYLAIESQRGSRSVFTLARRHWPDLTFVFVTDHPQPERSCFQALDLTGGPPAQGFQPVDLFAHPAFLIYRQNVEEHEALLRRMFVLLAGGP
jgi:hypothetical protein